MSVRKVLGKTRWMLLAGLASLAALVLALPPFRLTLLGWLRGEPCYDGRPLSYWRQQLGDWRVGSEPDLRTIEEKHQESAEQGSEEFLCVLGHTPGKWGLCHRQTTAQQMKAELRGFLDHAAGHGTCPNPTYGEPFCRLAILEGDPAAVPVLMALLKDEDLGIRRHAAAALGTIGPRARAAFPALLATAHHDNDALLRGIARTGLLDIDKEAAWKAGIVDHFIFWSPQPRLLATTEGSFFLDSPGPFLTDGKILARSDKDEAITLHELATDKVLASFQAPGDIDSPIAFSRAGKLKRPGRAAWASVLAFSRDGQTVASASKDQKTVMVWDLATGKVLAALRGHTDDIDSLAFGPEGKTLASGSSDKTVRLWDVSNGKNTATLRGHTASVSAVAFSPDGRTLASGGSWPDCTVKLWDVPTGKERGTCQHDPTWGGVLCLAFSPDGRTLASGSMDSSVMLVDVASGQKRATLDDGDETGSLDSVAFSPDGRTLAYVSWDKIFLCDVATGKNTAVILAEPGQVDGAVFTPDGRMLAVTRGREVRGERLWAFAAISSEKK